MIFSSSFFCNSYRYLSIEFFHRISSSPLQHLSQHYTQRRTKKTDSFPRSALRSRTPIDTTFLLPAAHRNGRATSSRNSHSVATNSLTVAYKRSVETLLLPINRSNRFLPTTIATISPFYSPANNNLSIRSTLFLRKKFVEKS